MPRKPPTPRPIKVRQVPTLKKGPLRHSKRVLDRLKATRSLLSTIDETKDKVAAGLRSRFASELHDGETVPDQRLALELAGRSVQTAFDLLAKADSAYCGRATRRRILNEACVAVARDQVYPELVDVRRAIDTRFGRDAGRGLHRIEGSTRRKPRRLYPQLEALVVALRDNETLPRPLRPGPEGERRQWLRQLEPGYQKLTAMLRDLDDHEIAEVRLRNDRDFELESFDVVYGETLDFVRSVLRLSGCHERVVWNLLPTVQRRRLKAKARKESEARAEGRR